VGVSLSEAVAATSAASARALGLDAGLAVGSRADLVVVDDALEVRRVLRAGAWL
jgi:N-acetylglucosamine-6-phosphate deacetylase